MFYEYYILPLGAKQNIGPNRQLPNLRGGMVIAGCSSLQGRREALATKSR